MRLGRKVGLVVGLAAVAAVAGYVVLAAGAGSAPAAAPRPVYVDAARPTSPSSGAEQEAPGGCCREHGGKERSHDLSKCPMHARESAAAQARADQAHKCPYLAGQRAKAEAAVGTEPPAAGAGDQNAAVYACPMHPEVQSTKKGRCPKCGMFLEPVR